MLARDDWKRAAPADIDPRVSALCAEFEIEIIGKSRYPMPGQTRAVASIRRLIDNYGEGHARLVLCILAEGKGNHALVDEMSLNAVSALLRACPDIVEGNTAALLDMFDRLPLGPYMAIANELRGNVHQGHALAGMLYLQLRQIREGSLTGREADHNRTKLVNASEVEKGRAPFRRGAHRTADEKIAIGQQLLDKKASLPRGQWGPWLKAFGLTDRAAHQFMKLARNA